MTIADTGQTDLVCARAWVPVLGAIILGAFILVLAIVEEPYNIDELRQTRAYDAPLAEVVQRSYEQEQPPLDPVLNAVAQRVIGVGDWQQRFLSVVLGVSSLGVVGLLGLRSAFGGVGAASSILVLALSPLIVSVTANARPYALPLFLMLLFVLATDVWLNDRRVWSAIVLVVSALLLPLSRTGEPLLALASSVLVLSVWKVVKKPAWSGAVTLPITAASSGMVVGIAVLLRLQEDASSFDITGGIQWAGLSRLASELPLILAGVFAPWPIAAAVLVIAFALPGSRKLLAGLWWFWPLVMTAIGFAVAFVLQTDADQAYVSRYTFSWWAPFAVCVGAIVGAASNGGAGLTRWLRSASAALVLALLLGFSARTVSDLTTEQGTDWSALSDAINRSAPDGATVLFDTPRPHGEYRTLFAGVGRYLDSEHHAPNMARIIQRPDTVRDSAAVVVVLIDYADDIPGWPIEVPGWHRFDSGRDASLFLSIDDQHGRLGARLALLEFSKVFEPDRGAALALAAAALAADDGDLDEACRIIDELTERNDEAIVRQIHGSLARAGRYGKWAGQCPA